LVTLIAPSAGKAYVAGHHVVDGRVAVRRVIAFVGDETGESRPSWTPREYIGYFARLRGLPHPRRDVERVLDAVGIETEWRHRPLATHSTGMKRRVELARALVTSPRVLFLDEPTRGLDLLSKHAMWDLLRHLAEDRGVTIFLSSHETAEIRGLAKRIAVIAHGRIAYQGPASALGTDPTGFEERLLRLLAGADTSKRSRPVAVS
jgi:ABC-2 type transport system ATP-binding protein